MRRRQNRGKKDEKTDQTDMTRQRYSIRGTPRFCSGMLFDLDNTLYDFVRAKEEACDAVVAITGGTRSGLIEEFLFGPWGVESHEAIRSYIRKIGTFTDEIYEEACAVYEKTKHDNMMLFPGVLETLQILSEMNLRLGAVSNALSSNAIPRLNDLQIRKFFEILITPDIAGVKKPDRTIFIQASDALGIPPEYLAMIGDNLYSDIDPAQKLGMTGIHASYGDRIPPEMNMMIEPDLVIHRFSDLPDLLIRI